MMRALLYLASLVPCTRGGSLEVATEAAPATPPPERARWLLEGAPDERLVRAAAPLRGFDVAMIETGHRYAELHRAGRHRSRSYAECQLGKLETAVARCVERRLRRSASARMLGETFASVRQAHAARDEAAFRPSFTASTTTCNANHRVERVSFMRVVPPTLRTSVVHAPEDAAR